MVQLLLLSPETLETSTTVNFTGVNYNNLINIPLTERALSKPGMPEYHGIWRNITEYHGIYRNITEYHDIFPEYTGTSQYFPMVAMRLFILNMDV